MNHPVTILSFGAGQDSTALLVMLLFDRAFRLKYAPGLLLVIFSDTGNEHPATYQHIEKMKALIGDRTDVLFLHLKPGSRYHIPSWQSLNSHHDRLHTIGSVAYAKTCSDNLKVQPIYKAVDQFVGDLLFDGEYDFNRSGKRAIQEYARQHGRVRVIIGIARGEESRVATGLTGKKWFDDSVTRVYPLIEEGLDRADCQHVIELHGVAVPPPSNCMRCPYLSKVELLWLWRNHPTEVVQWSRQEQNKLAKSEREGVERKKNYGVFKHKTIFETLEDAEAQHGHMTNADLDEYKMSHGHCVASKY